MKSYCSIPEAVEALAAGRILIVVDSEERENEGDMLAAAERMTAEMVHFMVTHARGHLCMPVGSEIADRLQMTPMVPGSPMTTPRFAVPLDHCRCHTGISPQERAETIRAIVSESSTAEDFVRPGHIFPLIARDGGILERPGHTEAAVDLARLAGLAPAGVLCEVCSLDGRNMADAEELHALAATFDLPVARIDDLIRFRQEHPSLSPLARPCDIAVDPVESLIHG